MKYVSDNLEFASERQELCQLKAKFQRSTKHKSRARDAAVADDADDDDAVAEELGCFDELEDQDENPESYFDRHRDMLHALLLGQDESSDDDDDDDNKDEENDLQIACDANMKIAISAAGENMEIDPVKLQHADEQVDDRLTTLLVDDPFASHTDRENEAFVQEILLRSLSFAQGTIASEQSSGSGSKSDTGVLKFSAIQGDCYCTKWCASVETTLATLKVRKNDSNRSVGENNELSLVLDVGDSQNGAAAVFVQWSTSASAKVNEGRVIKLDEDRKVICPVDFMHASKRFEGHEVILPAAGVQVKRVKKANRPEVPEPSLRLLNCFNAALLLFSQTHVRSKIETFAWTTKRAWRVQPVLVPVTGALCNVVYAL